MKDETVVMKKSGFRKNYTLDYLDDVRKIIGSMEVDLPGNLEKIADVLVNARDKRRTIFIMGNGGSAATASHFAGDLSKGATAEGGPRFKAIALTDNIPNLLAWANDKNYDDIFVEQLKNLMEPGDIVIGISGSGNSKNIIKAVEYANENGAITIGLTGFNGGLLSKNVKESIHVPSFNMQRVEDLHLLIEHLLTSMIKEEQEKQMKK